MSGLGCRVSFWPEDGQVRSVRCASNPPLLSPFLSPLLSIRHLYLSPFLSIRHLYLSPFLVDSPSPLFGHE